MADPLQLLLARAERVLGTRTIQEAALSARAIIGVQNIPAAETAAAAALDKLRKPALGRPEPGELAALELVIRLMRPAPLSRTGVLDPLPVVGGKHLLPPEVEQQWDAFRAVVQPLLYSIGRIDALGLKSVHVGTGFLVGADLLATNRHVLGFLSGGTEVLGEGQGVVQFHQESAGHEPPGAAAPIVGVAAIHPALDMVLLRVRLPAAKPPLTVDDEPAAVQQFVAAIGYPSKDAFRNPLFADAVLAPDYGVKRGALGEVLDVAPGQLFHDCSTTGGNSGSPIFSLKSGRVVGLHRSGFFLYRNEAIDGASLRAFLQEYQN